MFGLVCNLGVLPIFGLVTILDLLPNFGILFTPFLLTLFTLFGLLFSFSFTFVLCCTSTVYSNNIHVIRIIVITLCDACIPYSPYCNLLPTECSPHRTTTEQSTSATASCPFLSPVQLPFIVTQSPFTPRQLSVSSKAVSALGESDLGFAHQ